MLQFATDCTASAVSARCSRLLTFADPRCRCCSYTTLGTSKLFHPGHPLNFDEPLSWSQDAANGTNTGIRTGSIEGYPAYHRDSGKSKGCGYFDVCPTVDGSRDQFVDHHTATEVIATMDMAVKAKRPFFLGVGMIRPHLPFIVPTVRPNASSPAIYCSSQRSDLSVEHRTRGSCTRRTRSSSPRRRCLR